MELQAQSKVESAVFSSFESGKWRFLAGKTTLVGAAPAECLLGGAFLLWRTRGFCFNSSPAFLCFLS
jgi:hypothetical protein